MDDIAAAMFLEDPLQGIGTCIENDGSRPKPKRQLLVNIYIVVPAHTQQQAILGVDWYDAKGTADVYFSQNSIPAMNSNKAGSII